MKKTISFFLLFFSCALVGHAQIIDVYIFDNDGPFTNVRNSPNKGKVVDKIPVDVSATLTVEKPTNGWWRIVGECYECLTTETQEDGSEFANVKLKGSTTGYWIHNSVIGIGTRNYGENQKLQLRSEPSKSAAVSYTLKGEQTVHPIDVKGSWVKVKTADGKGQGWLEKEWLCSNPLTTCP